MLRHEQRRLVRSRSANPTSASASTTASTAATSTTANAAAAAAAAAARLRCSAVRGGERRVGRRRVGGALEDRHDPSDDLDDLRRSPARLDDLRRSPAQLDDLRRISLAAGLAVDRRLQLRDQQAQSRAERLAHGRLRCLCGCGALDALERVGVRLVHASRDEARAVLAGGLLRPRLLQPPAEQRRPVRWLRPLE